MEEKRKKKIIKTMLICVFVAMIVVAIVETIVLLSYKNDLNETNKNNQEIIERLEEE